MLMDKFFENVKLFFQEEKSRDEYFVFIAPNLP